MLSVYLTGSILLYPIASAQISIYFFLVGTIFFSKSLLKKLLFLKDLKMKHDNCKQGKYNSSPITENKAYTYVHKIKSKKCRITAICKNPSLNHICLVFLRYMAHDISAIADFSVIIKGHIALSLAELKILGKEYTKERIKERIDMKRTRKASLPVRNHSSRKLIDTTDEKFHNSAGLQRWANLENLKIASQTYNEVNSISELEQKIATLNETSKSAKQTVVTLERKMKFLAEIIKYAEQYKDNRSFQLRYKKAKDPDAFFRKYESQLILYDGAKRMLEQSGINPSSCNIEKLKAEYQALSSQKSELATTYRGCEKDVIELNRKLENLNQYLHREVAHSSEHSQDKNLHQI